MKADVTVWTADVMQNPKLTDSLRERPRAPSPRVGTARWAPRRRPPIAMIGGRHPG
ncbi:hypothetical protein VAB18032_17075 [Micromonospora maris AB-18-032]|nr:hypothetical protein VAB18032_17075 [Micromonospora maris AB-18-032]